jgi:hypothetical protein
MGRRKETGRLWNRIYIVTGVHVCVFDVCVWNVYGNSSYVITTTRPPPKKKNWGLQKFTREDFYSSRNTARSVCWRVGASLCSASATRHECMTHGQHRAKGLAAFVWRADCSAWHLDKSCIDMQRHQTLQRAKPKRSFIYKGLTPLTHNC